jgi:hypothetical protein
MKLWYMSRDGKRHLYEDPRTGATELTQQRGGSSKPFTVIALLLLPSASRQTKSRSSDHRGCRRSPHLHRPVRERIEAGGAAGDGQPSPG